MAELKYAYQLAVTCITGTPRKGIASENLALSTLPAFTIMDPTFEMMRIGYKKVAEEKVCKMLKISPEVINDPGRDNASSHARFLVWSILRNEFHLSQNQIAKLYGKDHTTVMHGIQRSRVLFPIIL